MEQDLQFGKTGEKKNMAEVNNHPTDMCADNLTFSHIPEFRRKKKVFLNSTVRADFFFSPSVREKS